MYADPPVGTSGIEAFVMAHRTSITSLWSSFLAALVALLAAVGLVGRAAPAAAAPTAPATPSAATVSRPVAVARRTWRAMMRGGSLPPTIKQRIRAEAHGKSPSVRRSATAAALALTKPERESVALAA
ncbi:DUF6344 domain-containing protein [Streptomyces racemochromogenes]|uniref:DUF6344 domain-containing protein n=1 Tax=Streptomyces racemochromogenes TaxID=67353 RepID=A0ABW7P7C1_9ACTN